MGRGEALGAGNAMAREVMGGWKVEAMTQRSPEVLVANMCCTGGRTGGEDE